mmetsp:Transcript_34027/g.68686  ORF Transcript_34027/g.68686 Transcript_34027/m.68686 type:complete len:142 (-) Transcript_34027:57-482(-)
MELVGRRIISRVLHCRIGGHSSSVAGVANSCAGLLRAAQRPLLCGALRVPLGSGLELASPAAGEAPIARCVPSAAAAAAWLPGLVPRVFPLLADFVDYLRPRKFGVRLDVKMKKGSSPYPRNPNRKKPVPRVKGIIRKLLD